MNEEDGWSVVVNEATKRVLVTEDDPRSAEDTWSVVVNEEDDWCQVDLKEYRQQPPEAAPATPQTPDSQATTPGRAVPEDLLFCEEYFHDITQPLTPEIRVNEQNTEEFDFVDLKCAKGNTKPLQDAEIFTSDDCYLAAQYGTPLQDDCWSDQEDEARELCSNLGMQRCSKYFLLDANVLVTMIQLPLFCLIIYIQQFYDKPAAYI